MQIPLTRFHPFSFSTALSVLTTLLTLHKACYLTLARLRHIGQPLCVHVRVEVCNLGASPGVCAWVRASVCVRVCKRWIRRHLQSYSIWCLCLHENTCLQWDSLSCCWACNMHHRPRLIHFFFRFDVALKMIFIYFLPSFLLTVWYGLPMTHDLWQDYCTNKQQAAQCSPCKMTSVSLSSIASITAQSRL